MKKRIQRGGFFFGPLFSMLTKSLKGGGVVKKRKKRKRKKHKNIFYFYLTESTFASKIN